VQKTLSVFLPVQKDERLFPEHDEDGVAQLRDLGQDEHERPESRHPVVFDETGKVSEFCDNG
jgi:hypothetical protein